MSEIKELNIDNESLSSTSYEESFDEEFSEESGDDYDSNNKEFHDDDDDLVIGEESKQDQTIISTISEELSNSVKDPTEISQKKDESNNRNEIFDDEYNNYYDYDGDDCNDNDDNINQELDYDCTESSAQLSTDRPSDLNEDNYKFHFNFFRHLEKIPKPNEKKYKNGTRKSLTFSNERMREIERHNQILLSKIISKGPSYENLGRRDSFKKVDKIGPTARKSSAAINRSKQQRQIDYENYILKQKLEAIAKRKTKCFN